MQVALDTETTGLDHWHGCRAYMVQMLIDNEPYYWNGEVNPLNRSVSWGSDDLEEIAEILYEAESIVYFNAKFDIHALEHIGIPYPHWDKTHDVMAAHHCIFSNEIGKEEGGKQKYGGLKPLSFKYLNYPDLDESELKTSIQVKRDEAPDHWQVGNGNFPTTPVTKNNIAADYWLDMDLCANYGCHDTIRTMALWKGVVPEVRKQGKWKQYLARMKVMKILYDMETHGIYMDVEKAKLKLETLEETLAELALDIKDLTHCGYNIDPGKEADKHMFFFNLLELPVLNRTDTGLPSLNKDSVKEYIETYPEIPAIQKFKEWQETETKRSYLSQWIGWDDGNSRIHPNYWLTGTDTCRQSADKPNGQNPPGIVQDYLIPPPGRIIVDIDLVNIELRIWAYLVGNQNLISIFERNESAHIAMAKLLPPRMDQIQELGIEGFKVTKEYTKVKGGNFSLVYGATRHKADRTYDVTGAYDIITHEFQGIDEYIKETNREAEDNLRYRGEFFVTTIGGYKLHVPRGQAHKTCNYKIQGSASYLMGMSMIEVANNPLYNHYGCKMFLQVHDSIKIDCPLLPEQEHKTLINSLIASVEAGGTKLIPTCKAEYKYVNNPADVPF